MSVVRILDLDLDFFVTGAAYWKESNSERLDAAAFTPWARDDAMAFLEERCKLTEKLPGFVVEHHGELFRCWDAAIDAGKVEPPFP